MLLSKSILRDITACEGVGARARSVIYDPPVSGLTLYGTAALLVPVLAGWKVDRTVRRVLVF